MFYNVLYSLALVSKCFRSLFYQMMAHTRARTHAHTYTPFLRICIIFAPNSGKLVFAILILDLGLFLG